MADYAIKLSTAGFDYGDARKPLRFSGNKSIHVSIFVSVEFPDESLLMLLEQYRDLKSRKLHRLHFNEEGYTVTNILKNSKIKRGTGDKIKTMTKLILPISMDVYG